MKLSYLLAMSRTCKLQILTRHLMGQKETQEEVFLKKKIQCLRYYLPKQRPKNLPPFKSNQFRNKSQIKNPLLNLKQNRLECILTKVQGLKCRMRQLTNFSVKKSRDQMNKFNKHGSGFKAKEFGVVQKIVVGLKETKQYEMNQCPDSSKIQDLRSQKFVSPLDLLMKDNKK